MLVGFGNLSFQPLGTVKLRCGKESNESQMLQFYVTDTADTAILGAAACETFNLVQHGNKNRIDSKSPKLGNLTKEDIISEYQFLKKS